MSQATTHSFHRLRSFVGPRRSSIGIALQADRTLTRFGAFTGALPQIVDALSCM